MHPRTLGTLKQLEDADWFANVGVKDTDAAIVLESWAQAMASCASIKWENHLIDGHNAYTMQLFHRNRDRFNLWNQIVDEVKPAVISLVARKTKQVIEINRLPKVFIDTVNWDIVGVCMEAEYADVYPPGFSASQAYWYLKGHFPCGWEGEFPQGKIVVY